MMEACNNSNNSKNIPKPGMITPQNFTPVHFRSFLLNTIFDDVLSCEMHRSNGRIYLTAVGKLMEDFFLVQIKSDDPAFDALQITHVPPRIVDLLETAFCPLW